MIDKESKVGKQCISHAFQLFRELITLVCRISFINTYRLSIHRCEQGWKVITQHPLMTWLEWEFEMSIARFHGIILSFLSLKHLIT
jgi:hypothetical protein